MRKVGGGNNVARTRSLNAKERRETGTRREERKREKSPEWFGQRRSSKSERASTIKTRDPERRRRSGSRWIERETKCCKLWGERRRGCWEERDRRLPKAKGATGPGKVVGQRPRAEGRNESHVACC